MTLWVEKFRWNRMWERIRHHDRLIQYLCSSETTRQIWFPVFSSYCHFQWWTQMLILDLWSCASKTCANIWSSYGAGMFLLAPQTHVLVWKGEFLLFPNALHKTLKHSMFTTPTSHLPPAPLPSVCVLRRFSHVRLFATLRAVARQAPLSLEFSGQE